MKTNTSANRTLPPIEGSRCTGRKPCGWQFVGEGALGDIDQFAECP